MLGMTAAFATLAAWFLFCLLCVIFGPCEAMRRAMSSTARRVEVVAPWVVRLSRRGILRLGVRWGWSCGATGINALTGAIAAFTTRLFARNAVGCLSPWGFVNFFFVGLG